MKTNVYSITGNVKGQVELGRTFSSPVREDLVKRAVLSEQSKNRQPYGVDPLAGKRTSAHYHGRRHKRHTMMNREMARMKRIHGSGHLNLTARFVPQAIKGRKAHPPKTEKKWEEKINKKERVKALMSAISASSKKDLVLSRGHDLNGVKNIPLVVVDNLEGVKTSREFRDVMKKLGLEKELERVKVKKIRSGRGTMRGRKYKKGKGPLVIVSMDKGVTQAGRNIPGIDIVDVGNLNVSMLAPGTVPGRLCIWTKSSIEKVNGIGK